MSAVLVQRYDIDRIAVLVLCNPPANGYSHAMHKALDAHIVDVRMSPDIDVIVLRGEGERFFCAGADIGYLQRLTPEQKYAFCLHANETLLRLEHTPKLVIAALNGHCVGGGLEIALACDLRVGRSGTPKPDLVGLPEVGLGVLPGTGGTQRLSRVLGRARALEFMVEGRNVPMDEAVRIGLVHQALPVEGWWSAVLDYARRFCRPQASASAVGLIKRAVVGGADLPLESALGLERELQQRLFTGADAREGMAAFTEKRRPVFTGGPAIPSAYTPPASSAGGPATAAPMHAASPTSPAGSPAAPTPPVAPPAPTSAPAASARSAPSPSVAPVAPAPPAAAPPLPVATPASSTPASAVAPPAPRPTAIQPEPALPAPRRGAVARIAPDPRGSHGWEDDGDAEHRARPGAGPSLRAGVDRPTDEGFFEGAFDPDGGRPSRVDPTGKVGDQLGNVKDAVLNLVPRGIVERWLLVPVRRDGDVLTVAMVDPSKAEGIREVEEETGLTVKVLPASETEIAIAITRYYRA